MRFYNYNKDKVRTKNCIFKWLGHFNTWVSKNKFNTNEENKSQREQSTIGMLFNCV